MHPPATDSGLPAPDPSCCCAAAGALPLLLQQLRIMAVWASRIWVAVKVAAAWERGEGDAVWEGREWGLRGVSRTGVPVVGEWLEFFTYVNQLLIQKEECIYHLASNVPAAVSRM